MASPQKPPAPTPAPATAPQQTAPTTTTTTPTTTTTTTENPFTHNVALGVTPIAMAALFLPPRRLDMRQVLLGGVAIWGTNQLVYDYSGRSFAQRLGARMASMAGTELPEKAKQTQALLRREKERRKVLQGGEKELLERLRQEARALGLPDSEAEAVAVAVAVAEADVRKRVLEEEEKAKAKAKGKKERGTLEAIWMGDQDDDWKEKRDQREKEALREGGGGYWGLITDQFAEVWNKGWKKELDAQAAEVKAKADADRVADQGKKP